MKIMEQKVLKIFFTIIMIIMLTSCGGAKDSNEVLSKKTGNFETTANIKYKEINATAIINQESPKSCSVKFTSPQSLADISFVFKAEGVELTYKGLSFTFDPNSVPGKAVAEIAVSSIRQAFKNENMDLKIENDAIVMSGMLETGEFFLKLDPQSENLLKLSVPSEDLEIEFINFKFLD